MHTTNGDHLEHEHTFGQERIAQGEKRTLWVAAITAVFMVVEIAAGLVYGSMALLADGLHMGSHALALGIAVVAYVYARRYARDKRFSFGTGKVNALGGFTGALLLAVFAAVMAWESFERFLQPVEIVFDQAIAVAVVGLLVNGLSVAILGVHQHGDHGHDHGDHGHSHGADEDHDSHVRGHHDDHNLRSAYLHVLADALTSVTAIFALLGGKYFNQIWLDPAMGIVGSLLVARWSWGLLRDSGRVLLDHQAPTAVQDRVRSAIEGDSDDRVVDLHVWSIGPGLRAACISVVTHQPNEPDHYRALIPTEVLVVHSTVEVRRCRSLQEVGS
jgi:cation diffusion facilitator family transporter